VKKLWTDQENRFLKLHYPDTPTYQLAEKLNRSTRSVYHHAYALGIQKSKEFLDTPMSGRLRAGNRCGEPTKFKPGHKPHNAGVKGWQAGGNATKTQFQPGHRPHNSVPVGSERVTKDGIHQRKVSEPNNWRSIHALLWEKHQGPVSKGCIVVFKNGNSSDIRIENLEMITRGENLVRNSINNLPKPLAEVCRLRGVLNRHINKKRRAHEKQQD